MGAGAMIGGLMGGFIFYLIAFFVGAIIGEKLGFADDICYIFGFVCCLILTLYVFLDFKRKSE